jgi:hypothetical protein
MKWELREPFRDDAISFLGHNDRRVRGVDRDRLRAGSADVTRLERLLADCRGYAAYDFMAMKGASGLLRDPPGVTRPDRG